MRINPLPTLLHPYVRFINAGSAEKVDFYIRGSKKIDGIKSGEMSQYIKCNRGQTLFTMDNHTPDDSHSHNITINLNPGDVYTICGSGSELHEISENIIKENSEYGHLRICHMWNDGPKVNLFTRDKCFASEIAYGTISKYIEFIPGEYNIMVSDCKTGRNILTTGTLHMKAGKYNSLYILTHPAGCIFATDAGSYNTFSL